MFGTWLFSKLLLKTYRDSELFIAILLSVSLPVQSGLRGIVFGFE